jgi:NADPH:quinone reductase-like Zn-dependent oxidoreductase
MSTPMMKAVRIYEYGDTDVLKYEEIPVPAPRPAEVLVRVRACALNHLDLWIRQGLPRVKTLPHILGSDVAGEIAAVGSECWRLTPGQRVLLAPALSCRQCEQCLSGEDNLCPRYGLLGSAYQGGNAEYIAVPEWAAIPIPEHLPFDQAAAVPLVFLTAWHMLFARAGLKAGEDVLVLAASSGVGMAAIQIAKLFHCRVIATAGGDEKMARAKDLGADFVIDHYKQDIAAEVKNITAKRGVDVVFEHVGAATWQKSYESLARNGRLVTCGITTGYDVKLDLRPLFGRQQALLGSFMGTLRDLFQVLKFVFNGQLRPVIDRVYPLEEIAAAHQRIEDKAQFGKVVVIP